MLIKTEKLPVTRILRNSNSGFILGVVLLVCLVMAAFIFSFNSIVRQRNVQAHHLAIAEKSNYLAISGLKLFSRQLNTDFEATIKVACPELFTKTADELGTSIDLSTSSPLCSQVKSDFQNFLNTLNELKDGSVIGGGFPVCEKMEIRLEKIAALTPDTTEEQFQAGRDPIEKCGQIVIKCAVRTHGLTREASLYQQFRVISMIPGPFARFTLFVSKTPDPNSYNSMGVKFDGQIDGTYEHFPADNKKFTGPLVLFNGTDTEEITASVIERTDNVDDEHLRKRGWVFLGASGATNDGPVFLKIPSGFNDNTGGHFMLGWPSNSAMPVLSPELIVDDTNFAPDSDFSGHSYNLGGKFQGLFTWEDGNPDGAGAKNIWPKLTSGPTFTSSDRVLSASTWLYPFGNKKKSSRTLMVGPVLAGFLKYYFIRGTNGAGAPYKGLFGGMSESDYISRAGGSLPDMAMLWSGILSPDIPISAFFKNGYNSFKQIMPFNSLPDPSPILPSNGVSFNLLFDFMKYQRDSYPHLDSTPRIAQVSYFAKKYLVPRADAMNSCPIKGIHPFNDMGIFFKENGAYDPNYNPENCYFYGDLSSLTVFNSNLISNRISHILDLSNCANSAEESDTLEKFIFEKNGAGSSAVNVPKKSGIFLIKRRPGASKDFSDAILLSTRKVKVTKPIVLILDKGSLNIQFDIISNLSGNAPEQLMTIALSDGDFYLSGSGFTRKLHAYLIAIGTDHGRLLKPSSVMAGGPSRFEIYGGLALREIGLYESSMADPLNHIGTTMKHFSAGGEIHYNSRFNPSAPTCDNSRIFTLEETVSKFELSGGE